MTENSRNIRLKVKELIGDLDAESIKNFVLHYAKQDKAFEMAFKSHFISQIRLGHDESIKYKRLLDELIKPKNAHNKIGPSQKKIISIVLKDFVLQMNDCLSTDNFTEAFYLTRESLAKIAYLQNRYQIKDKGIEASRQALLSGLSVILSKQLAPAFRNKIEKELLDLVQKSYYVPGKNNLIEVLNSNNVLVEEDKETLITDLLVKIKDVEDKQDIIQTIIQLSHPFVRIAKKLLLEFSHSDLYSAFIAMINEGKFEFVDFYLENPEIQFNHNKDLLNIYKFIEKDDHTQLNKAINRLDVNEYSIIDLKEVCDSLSDIYLRKEFPKIRKWVDKLQFSLSSEMYAKAHMDQELIEMIESKKDIEWLKVYDKTLIERGQEKEVARLYLDIVDDYMSNHIGTKASDYLEKVKYHLLGIGAGHIYKKVHKHIYKKFQHRISISPYYG